MHHAKSTLAFVRRLRVESASNQKTAITLDQAAKLFAISNLGITDQFQNLNLSTGQEIDAFFGRLGNETEVSPDILGDEISHWKSWFQSGSSQALSELAQKGFMLLSEPSGEGNTDQRINLFNTDKTLNRGDFESPAFNGKTTHG